MRRRQHSLKWIGIVTFSFGSLQQAIAILSAFLEVSGSVTVLLSGGTAHANLNPAQDLVTIAIVDNNGSRQALIGICVHKSIYL